MDKLEEISLLGLDLPYVILVYYILMVVWFIITSQMNIARRRSIRPYNAWTPDHPLTVDVPIGTRHMPHLWYFAKFSHRPIRINFFNLPGSFCIDETFYALPSNGPLHSEVEPIINICTPTCHLCFRIFEIFRRAPRQMIAGHPPEPANDVVAMHNAVRPNNLPMRNNPFDFSDITIHSRGYRTFAVLTRPTTAQAIFNHLSGLTPMYAIRNALARSSNPSRLDRPIIIPLHSWHYSCYRIAALFRSGPERLLPIRLREPENISETIEFLIKLLAYID